MSVVYSEDFKKQVVRAYMKGDKSLVSIAAEFNIGKTTVSSWVKKYGGECQNTTSDQEQGNAAEIRRLHQVINEKDKEIAFLKKAAAFFAREID